MVDPNLTSVTTSYSFVDIVYELQIMCSDRVDPNDPVLLSIKEKDPCEEIDQPQADTVSITSMVIKPPAPQESLKERIAKIIREEKSLIDK